MKADRPSATAQVVAGSLLCLAHHPQHASLLAQDPLQWRAWVMTGNAGARALHASAQLGPTRRFWRWLERRTLPGGMAHYARRKARIEAHCREALAQGAQRVVVLGAGLDTLALRLAPAYPQVDWVELDHPATQALKLAGLARSGHALPPNVRWQTVDLTEPLALQHAMQDWPERPSVFIAEGLLMYLAPSQVSALVKSITTEVCHVFRGKKADHGSIPMKNLARHGFAPRLIATYMRRTSDGRAGFSPQSPWIDRWLRWRGEPFVWAEHPQDMSAWAQREGLVLLAHETAPFGASQGDALQGENLIVASVA
jgi:methyltransferase (TIGR00027 family)